MQNYKIDILSYTKNGSVKSDCADIAFQNVGLIDVILNNGYTLSSGSVLSLSANENEIDRTIYTFSFQNATGTGSLIVIRKVYI